MTAPLLPTALRLRALQSLGELWVTRPQSRRRNALRSLVLAERTAVSEVELVSLSHLGRIRPDIAARLAERRAGTSPAPASGDPGRAELESMLARFGGNVSAVAKQLGKTRPSVYRLMQRVGLSPSERDE